MPTLNDLANKINNLFGSNLLTPAEVNVFINFLLDEFAFNFPYLKMKIIPSADITAEYIINLPYDSGNIYVAVDKLDKEHGVLSIIGYLPKKHLLNSKYYAAYLKYNIDSNLDLSELAALRLYSEYSNVLGSPYNLIKPNIFTLHDYTNIYGEYQEAIIIPKDHVPCAIFYYSPRFLNKEQGKEIDPKIYQILEAYVIYKFIDYMYLENMEQSINAITTFYQSLQNFVDRWMQNVDFTDSTTLTYMRSISIGEISISFDTYTNQLNTLTSLISRVADMPNKMGQGFYKMLEKMRKEYETRFKRKKLLYYSGQIYSAM